MNTGIYWNFRWTQLLLFLSSFPSLPLISHSLPSLGFIFHFVLLMLWLQLQCMSCIVCVDPVLLHHLWTWYECGEIAATRTKVQVHNVQHQRERRRKKKTISAFSIVLGVRTDFTNIEYIYAATLLHIYTYSIVVVVVLLGEYFPSYSRSNCHYCYYFRWLPTIFLPYSPSNAFVIHNSHRIYNELWHSGLSSYKQ